MKNNMKYKHLIVLAFLCIAIMGFIESIKGMLIPSIRSQFGVNYSAIGMMLLISSFGYLFATLFSGLVADKLGKKNFHVRIYCINHRNNIILCGKFFSNDYSVITYD